MARKRVEEEPTALEPWNAPPVEDEPEQVIPDRPMTAVLDEPAELFDVVEPDAPQPPAAAPAEDHEQPRRRTMPRSWKILAGLIVAAIVLLGVGLTVSNGGGSKHVSAPLVPADTSSGAPAPAPDADCPDVTKGPVTTGRDAGGTTSGPAVIKAFDYAYYVTRSGAQARSFVAPSAAVGGADQIQAAIDRLDPQTLHCLQITDDGAGLFTVQLTEQPPRGADPVVIHQKIQTAADSAGKFSIISIQPDK